MTRLIDADKITYTPSVPTAVISRIVNAGREEDAKGLLHVSLAEIEAQPTVDAEPVIWCSECYFWDKEPNQTAMPEVHTCRYWRIGTTSIDYCGRASRDGWLKAIPKESKQ